MATKKTKKFETPIDQRETFVSIQRSFADSELSVEEKLMTLYALQQVDSQIDKILQLRGELPLEVEALENELEEIASKEAAISAEIEENAATIAHSKQCIVEYDAQTEKYKAQLETVSNSREFDSLQKEIENQELLRAIAEKTINETRERNLDRKQALENMKEKMEIKAADLAAKKEELATIVEATSAEEKKLQAQHDECASKIDERTISAYERIRKSCNNHLAVVSVYNGNACGGCMCTIPPQRLLDIATNKKMIICEYCGRILMNPDKAE
ncbi:MAG: hypothetical protein KBT05_02930 [Bacteroidales bacterium]|nr:hypothetical protein [Candidatus Cryptobacteroides caccocaballi]